MRALRGEIVFATALKPAAAPEITIKSAQCLLLRHAESPLLGQSHLGGRRPQLDERRSQHATQRTINRSANEVPLG